ncbi:hypothetical protein Scep_028034 [Stephania cephalantha]|uniref:Uncharacterized protein n=1 Tax=Stephania cephalantha TaxID=152367 RepID=A0AAP0EDR3_9MAGN
MLNCTLDKGSSQSSPSLDVVEVKDGSSKGAKKITRKFPAILPVIQEQESKEPYPCCNSEDVLLTGVEEGSPWLDQEPINKNLVPDRSAK